MTALVALAFATFFNNAIHWYTHFSTYPMLGWVGDAEFVGFHQEYERRLALALYVPYGLLLAASLAFVFVRPDGVRVGWALGLLGLNLAVAALSVALAVPVHRELDRIGRPEPSGLRRLLHVNGARLATATVSSAVVLYLLVRTYV